MGEIIKPLLIILLVFVILLIITDFVEDAISNNRYNNGICQVCGGNYIYQQAIGHHFTTGYIYRCNKCGNLIEVNIYYNEENE